MAEIPRKPRGDERDHPRRPKLAIQPPRRRQEQRGTWKSQPGLCRTFRATPCGAFLSVVPANICSATPCCKARLIIVRALPIASVLSTGSRCREADKSHVVACSPHRPRVSRTNGTNPSPGYRRCLTLSLRAIAFLGLGSVTDIPALSTTETSMYCGPMVGSR